MCIVMLLGMMPPMSARAEEEEQTSAVQTEPAVEETQGEAPEEEIVAADNFSVGATGEKAAKASKIWTKEELATGIRAVPTVMLNNSAFMKAYVYESDTLNLNSRFELTGSTKAKGAGKTLPKGTITGDGNDDWYASYRWSPTQEERDMLAQRNTRLYFDINLIPAYEKHWYVFWIEKHWNYSSVRLTKANADGSNNWTYKQNDYGGRYNGDVFEYFYAKEQNSGEPQHFSSNWADYPAGDRDMYINIYDMWNVTCGKSKASGAVMYMTVDSDVQGIVTDISGDEYQTLKSDSTQTLRLDFSDDIRFADNASHDGITLTLAAEFLEQSNRSQGFEIEATLSEMGRNYMVFSFPVKKEYQHFRITGVKAQGNDLKCAPGEEVDLKIFDSEGNPLQSYGQKSQYLLTDVYGNPWTSSGGSLSVVDHYFDGVDPTLTKIDMFGNDISANSTKAPTSWNENSGNNRFVYAGAGDKIGFRAYFSEEIRKPENLSDVRAVLSITDSNGNPVELSVKKHYDNYIEFNELTVTADMLAAGERICITGFKNLTVKDLAGNTCATDLTKNIMMPAQDIALDVDKPVISSSIPDSYLLSEGVYRPYESALGLNYFSFPVTYADFDNNGADNSGISGKDVSFSLNMPSGNKYNYKWIMNTSQTVAAGATWNNGTTGSKNTFKDVSDNTQYWIHIQLDPNVEYDYATVEGGIDGNGIHFIGTLDFANASDWAGNPAGGNLSYTIKQQIDEGGPSGAMTSSISVTPNYSATTVNFVTSFRVTDDYSIERVLYRWWTKLGDAAEYTPATADYITLSGDQLGTGLNREFRYTTPAFQYNYGGDTAARYGSVKLEVIVEDRAGNAPFSFVSDPASFNYDKAVSNSSVTVNDPTQPVAYPGMNITAPTAKGSPEVPPRTMVLIPIPDSMDANGNYTRFYAWDAWDWVDHVNEYPAATGGNPFKAMLDALDALETPEDKVLYQDLPGSFYELTGTVDAQNCIGTFTEIYPYYSSTNLSEIRDFFADYYGRMDIYLVTSSSLKEFTTTKYGYDYIAPEDGQYGPCPDDNPEDLSFEKNYSTLDVYTVYLANKPVYKVTTTSVVNAQGQTDAEAERKLNYETGSGRPLTSLDNVAVTIQITNESDKTAIHGQGYGLQFLDFTGGESVVKLYYQGETKYVFDGDMSAYTPIKTWNLVQTGDGSQTIVIEPGLCTENGWYIMTVDIKDGLHNQIHSFNLSEQGEDPESDEKFAYYCQFFMDNTELDITATNIKKSFTETLADDEFDWALDDIQARFESGEAITIGMAPMPEGWQTDLFSLSFVTVPRPENDPAKKYSGLAAIRIYNETYNSLMELETNPAAWESVADSYTQTLTYSLYLADPETPSEDPYEEGSALPMLPGRNLVIYEIMAPNGIVTTREIVIDAVVTTEKWSLEYELLPNEELPTSANVWPVDSTGAVMDLNVTELHDMTIDQSKYNFFRLKTWVSQAGDYYNDDSFVASYKFRSNVVDHEYAMIDPNGNVSVQTLSILDQYGDPVVIDGTEPYYVGFSGGSEHPFYAWGDDYSSGSAYYGNTFLLRVYTGDHQSWMDIKDMTLTFDAEYSALLGSANGTMDENGQLTMPIPLALDENGELLMNEDGTYAAWESYDTNHNGIFYTRVTQVGPTDEDAAEYGYVGWLEIDIMGTWKYDPYMAEDPESDGYATRVLTVSASDAYGNVESNSRTFSYYNEGLKDVRTVAYENGSISYDSLTSDGMVGLAFTTPFASLEGYGVNKPALFVDTYEGHRKFYATAPMITQDCPIIEDENGNETCEPYMLTATDLFGQTLEIPVEVFLFGELGVDVSFSTTDPTNQPVTVYAATTGNVEKIASIVASDGTVGTIDPLDPSKASIAVENNCTVTITTDAVPASVRTVKVTNIDKAVDPVVIRYYDEYYNELIPSIGATSVTAVLCCDTEFVFATNGDESYTFPAGSKAGATYTFEYRDEAGNTGTITATLPMDLTVSTETADTEAPNVNVGLYMVRNTTLELMDRFINPGYVEEAAQSEITATLNTLSEGVVRANSFRLALNVSDSSNWKVVVAPTGSTAPTDYATAQQGSTVDGVTLVTGRGSATITVTKNASFDIHVIDEAGNVNSMTDVIFRSIDNEAPQLFPVYESGMDPDTGLPVITATFHPQESEKFEEIFTITSNVPSREVVVKDADGNDVTVVRYYHIFTANGEFSFTYQDDLGNVGTASAQAKGLTFDPARVLSESWYGTRKNGAGGITPANSDTVSNNITAQLRLNKSVSNVELFVYSADAPDHIGDALDDTYPVTASANATNINLVYTGNVNTQVVVRYTSSNYGITGTYILPAVTCIDKEMPVVTLKETVVADNKQSVRYVFETSEPVVLSQTLGQGFQTRHVFIATENKSVELSFTDQAGNQVNYPLDVTAVDRVKLETNYSASADGSNPTHTPALDLALSVGTTLYVFVNKNARAVLNGQSVGDFVGGTWNPMTLPADTGVHILTLTDSNTGEVVMDAVWAKASDRIAPEIHLPSATVLAHVGDTAESMDAAVREGVTVTDNQDSGLTFQVTGVPTASAAGLYTLTYIASDAAGNRITVSRYLYVMDGSTPILYVNGEACLPYAKIPMARGTMNLVLQRPAGDEDQPIVIKFRKGLFTTGQMKYYAETVENMTFDVTDTGHYTIYVRNQDRTEFVTYIYVEG